ncbi:MAG TPA: ABC transporter permease [Candidatus Limnocylindrales bacterium]|nr:ABC transporter permease [Candidatus Limnocylindrales bacterium]
MTATTASIARRRTGWVEVVRRFGRDNAWTLGLLGFLALLLVFTKLVNPNYSVISLQYTATSVLPLALAAVAQAVVVLSGGIDLSISSQMALTSCVAATLMKTYPGDGTAVGVVLLVLALGLLLGAINGALVVVTRVPDIIVTLATFFVWAGFALLVRAAPGGAAADWLKSLVVGPLFVDFLPKAAVLLVVIVAVIWLPLSRSRLGLSLYAIGSNPLAAFRSGVPVNRTKVASYAITGLIAAFAGLSLTASTGIGTPVPEPTYVLISIAAVVLGGVSLAGGTGGVFGPIVAVVVLQLIRDDMTFLRVDPNYGLVAQGFILIGVLMVGSFIQMRRSRA